jgi:hypothetical protein
VLGFLAAFAIQTDAFRAWSATVDWLWHANLRNKPTLSWLVPVFLCALPAWRFLHREMRDCRMSLTLLWLTVVLGGVLAGMAISGPLPLAPMSARLVQCGVAMLAAQCLCLSFLFQARHAIYITVEPPAERAAWFIALWRRYREAAKETRATKSAGAKSGSAVPAARVRRAKQSRRSSGSGDAPLKEAEEPITEPAPKAAPNAKPQLREQRPLRRSA